jgi:hypothetical protein
MMGDIANSAFDVGTLGGTDQLWAQLLQANRQLTGWMPFTVGAPAARLPTLTVNPQSPRPSPGDKKMHFCDVHHSPPRAAAYTLPHRLRKGVTAAMIR